MKSFKTLAKIGGIALILGIPLLALAQAPPAPVAPVQSFTDVINLIDKAVNWLFAILIGLSIVFIIWAAFKYLTAGGDQEKIKEANHTLIYAAVAIGVAIVAKAIPILVRNFIG